MPRPPPAPAGPATQRAAETSAVLQVPTQQLERERSRAGGGSRPRAAPARPAPTGRSLRRAGSAHTARRPLARPPDPGTRGLTAAAALRPGAPRAPPATPFREAHGGRRRTKALPGARSNRPLSV